jgi:hypothetical protein
MLSLQLLSRLGATLIKDNLFLCRVLLFHRGKTQELLLHQDLVILGRDQFPHQECRSGEIIFTTNGTLDRVLCLCPWDRAWGNPSQIPLNVMHTQPSMSYFGNQPMMSPHMQNPYASHGHGFYQNLGQQPKLFLATWCQSNSRSLFPWLSPTTQTTFPSNLAFSKLDKVVE